MDKRDARQAWISHIIDKRCGGKVAAFARAIGKDASYVSRMLYPADKKGAKGIGEDTVAVVAKAFPNDPPPRATGISTTTPTGHEEIPEAKPSGTFTKERRASDDVVALRIGVESLLLAVLQRTPGAATAFLADVEQVAKGHRFSTTAGFLGELVGIAKRVRSIEEEAAQARQRAGSAGRTKP